VTVTVSLQGVNDAPVTVADAFIVQAGQTTRLDVLGNDRDAEGDALLLTVDRSVTLGATAVVFDGATGRQAVDYTPPSQFDNLLPGQQVIDSFRYTANDSNGGLSTTTVTITITGPNNMPVAMNDSQVTFADATAVIAVLANDVDTDPGQTLNVVQINGQAISPGNTVNIGTRGATLTLAVNNTILFSPNGGYGDLGSNDSVTETFTYQISDSNGGFDDAVVTVQVRGRNADPIAIEDGYVAVQGTVFSTSDPDGNQTPTILNDDGVLANDSDPNPSDAANLKAFINIPPQHASQFTLNQNGTFVYRHDGSDTFQDTFFYIVDDGSGGSSVAQVTITLSPRPVSVWQNNVQPLDVNNDGFVTPLDALLIINSLNIDGSRPLPSPAVPPNAPPPFYDTNGDGEISPVDVLLVINQLNNPSNQSEGEGEAFGIESFAISSNVLALPEQAVTDQGSGYGEALATYILQNEDAAPTRQLRTRLSSLVQQTSVDADAYRVAHEAALASGDQSNFADVYDYDVLAQDSLHDASDVDDAIFGGDQNWL
jgi:VCBS repeat-containing protein